MPWVKEDLCIGCGACEAQCPANAITVIDRVARINDSQCIRCGTCHSVCPREAVRHDSERIPLEIEANVEWVKRLLAEYETPSDKRGLIERMSRYFAKQKKVAEQTMQQLREIGQSL